MRIDPELLQRFEEGLRPEAPARSRIPAEVLGYGEISSIFRIRGAEGLAFKRLPIFADAAAAGAYAARLTAYCRHLAQAGLRLPPHATAVLHLPHRPAVLYIAQPEMPGAGFAHRRLHEAPARLRRRLEAVAAALGSVWVFNRRAAPAVELAVDGQLSNWCFVEEDLGTPPTFVDTGTPMFRLDGREQLDPEPLLRSAPAWLRWVLRGLFLGEVMNRYYDPRRVALDLAANLHKEQRPDLIPLALEVLNAAPGVLETPLTRREVEAYYRQDRIIWQVFLAFRRLDRWIAIHLAGRRYEFILPGAIRR